MRFQATDFLWGARCDGLGETKRLCCSDCFLHLSLWTLHASRGSATMGASVLPVPSIAALTLHPLPSIIATAPWWDRRGATFLWGQQVLICYGQSRAGHAPAAHPVREAAQHKPHSGSSRAKAGGWRGRRLAGLCQLTPWASGLRLGLPAPRGLLQGRSGWEEVLEARAFVRDGSVAWLELC